MPESQESSAMEQSTAGSVTDLLWKQEPLHPELARTLHTVPGMGACLKHRLVYAVPYVPQMNALLNAQYAAKVKACRLALENEDWSTYLVMHEKPYRFEALATVEHRVSDALFWELFADTYVGSENWYEEPNRTLIDQWLSQSRGGLSAMRSMMTANEQRAYDRLPPCVKVWRGWNRTDGLMGYSWTRKRKCGQFFAERLLPHGELPYVAEGAVGRSLVIAYFSRRGEQEVFVPTEQVAIWRIHVGGRPRRSRCGIVTFDFDGTLHGEMDGAYPRLWWRVPSPNGIACDALRTAARQMRVAVIVNRDPSQIEPVLAFLRMNELPVDFIYPTYEGPKRAVLASLRPIAHYDDDPAVTSECPPGTSFVYMKG